MNFTHLENKYKSDARFNKIVNVFVDLLDEFEFLPSEIREALFFAQYRYEISKCKLHVRNEKDWRMLEQARILMKDLLKGGE